MYTQMKGNAACGVLKQPESVLCCCFSGLDAGHRPFLSLLVPFRELQGLETRKNSYSGNTHLKRPHEESRCFHPKGFTGRLWGP